MIISIINTIFSLPYFLIGILTAIILDLYIHKTKITTRLTFIEIWGCIMCWPIVTVLFIITYFKNN